MKELQRKRHLATPGVSFKGRVRKVAKWRAASDAESEEESESKFLRSGSDMSCITYGFVCHAIIVLY